MLSFQYLKDEDDSFTVDFYKGYDFPQTLYHFCHSNEEEQVFIEKNEDFQFNTEMVETAKAFVKKVYGIDCSEADVHAYGYANKVSVQLNVAANVIFQVRFYYKDDVPVEENPEHAIVRYHTSAQNAFVRRALPRDSRSTFLHPRDPLATVSRLSVRRLAPDHICS